MSEPEWKEKIREKIRDDSTLDLPYISMNILAAIIACYGLFANSPAVVIGAMIVAMLLGPIIGTALALVDSDMSLLRKGLTTLLAGNFGVLAIAFILGIIHRDIPVTHEIMARTTPNLIDLMIALAGGAAGAYATISPRLSIAFIGVAIATALVPPLSASGILFARGNYQLGLGAFLLAFTNMVAIQFASSAVLWLSGFRRVTQSKGMELSTFIRRNAVSLITLLILGSLLTANLNSVIAKHLFETKIRATLMTLINTSPGYYVDEVRIETDGNKIIVRAVVRGPNPPLTKFVADLEDRLPASPDRRKIELRVRYVYAEIINRNGLLYTDSELELYTI